MRIVLFLLLMISLESSAQYGFFNNAEIGFSAHHGSFFTASVKADYLKDSYTRYGELWVSKPVKNFPKPKNTYPLQWGLSIFYGNTGSRQYLGKMGGSYGYLDFPILGSRITSLRMRTGLGMGLIEHPYDVETNHKNMLIGSKANLFIHAGIKNVWHLNENLNIYAGLSLSHLSNATMKLPNLGLNVPSFSAGFSALINKRQIEYLPEDSFQSKSHTLLQLTTGTKESPWVNSKNYMQWILSAEKLFQRTRYGRYGGGLALMYDPSQKDLFIDSVITVGIKNYPVFNLSAFAAYEVILGRLSVPLQAGVSLFNARQRFFQNYGVRYRVSEKLSLSGMLKTHGGSADFLHGGITYHLK